jgi:single-strand DNA-binding protein
MASYNRVVLMGNVTRDPEVRFTPGGAAVCDIGLAVNRTWFDKQANEKKESVTFVDCTLWARTAEIAGEYLKKGSSCLIEGRLELDQWEDRETGKKRSKLKVVGESLQLLGGRQEGSQGAQRSQERSQSHPATQSQEPQWKDENQSQGELGYEKPVGRSPNDDEVPF